ncbi:hypothetical protein OIU79_004023 [Salix purpurea]|uniref:Uncharacterized protein n=1 Tax=Salix purpurea TaxID=77065 RepID=A0A9Q0U976_SALPP|nr:hypothetical protein OIU79_004023 [Salix purpurea]
MFRSFQDFQIQFSSLDGPRSQLQCKQGRREKQQSPLFWHELLAAAMDLPCLIKGFLLQNPFSPTSPSLEPLSKWTRMVKALEIFQ